MDILAYYFLFYVGLFLPFAAFRSAKRVRENRNIPSRKKAYLSTLFSLSILLFITVFTARRNWITLFPTPVIGVRNVLIGLAALGLKLGYFFLRRRNRSFATHPSQKLMAPRTAEEKALFVIIVALAAVTEEAAYRGVAFQLFWWLTGSAWIGAAASALAFGLSHQVQGWKVVIIVFFHALLDQLVVYLTGSLYIVIAVHFIYDLIAGFLISARIETVSNEPVAASG